MITALIERLTGNPWFLVTTLALGLVVGGGAAWYVQGLRLDAVKAEYAAFVSTTKAAGVAATKAAVQAAAADKLNKEKTDNELKTTIVRLAADNDRLRNSRAGRGYVPAAPAGSSRTDLACFDRTELESALRQLDEDLSKLFNEGDTDAVSLNAARNWAAGLRKQ